MNQDPAIRDIISELEQLAADAQAVQVNKRSFLTAAELVTVLLKAARTVRDQQYQIIELEEANSALTRSAIPSGNDQELSRELLEARTQIEKLKKRNANQAALLNAIDEGRAKKVPGGGWTHDDIPHKEVTTP